VVGKFAPLHRGHLRVLDEALARCERLSVWVYSRPDFPDMPSPLRRGWVRSLYPARLFPGLDLLPDAPQSPLNDEPDAIHRAYVRGVLDGWGVRPDAVFTSEAYGEAFAASLGAAHVCVDRARAAVPVSGSALRADVHGLRGFLEPLVYAHFVRRVVILGAESTGKSTLTRALAEAFGTAWVREYGRDVYERENGALTEAHFLEIARGHRALEDEAITSPGCTPAASATKRAACARNPTASYRFATASNSASLARTRSLVTRPPARRAPAPPAPGPTRAAA